MSIPPVGAPRKRGTTLLKKLAKIIFWLAVLWAFGVISHDDMCDEMNNSIERCQ